VLVRPVRVQGADAAADVAAGVREITAEPDVDVVIVGRGGGSVEDLWAFNTEAVARAIVATPVPVISAVGHEIDVTIADYAADVRAPTPTAAAALAVPDRREVLGRLGDVARRAERAVGRHVAIARMQLERLARAVQAPRRQVHERQLHVDALAARVRRAFAARIAWQRRELGALGDRLRLAHPLARVARHREAIVGFDGRLHLAMGRHAAAARGRLDGAAGKLAVLSPLASLARGYAIVRRADGSVVRDAAALAVGEDVALVLGRGRARARIVETEEAT
jgi:exodeoxyribonuclease VII large subunit